MTVSLDEAAGRAASYQDGYDAGYLAAKEECVAAMEIIAERLDALAANLNPGYRSEGWDHRPRAATEEEKNARVLDD